MNGWGERSQAFVAGFHLIHRNDRGSCAESRFGSSAIRFPCILRAVEKERILDGFEGSRAAGFFKGGSDYCGPVAASNSLVWLARQGALAGEFEKPGDQYALAVGENGLAKMKQAPVSGRLWKSSQSGVGKRD